MPIGWRRFPKARWAVLPPEALEAIVELDLTHLAGVEPPRGYGRD
jgi:hypothetical protein